MKVSVVIPAFNEEAFIGACLRSVFNQVEPPDEIIVVDNNSKDLTAKIAEILGAKVIREKKQGLTHARNRGFNSAKHEIIVRCDADTVVAPNWIKKIRRNFGKHKIDALSGPVVYTDYPLFPKSPIPSKIYLESLRVFSKGKRYLIGMNMSLSQEIWHKVKNKASLEDSEVHEDIDLSIKIARSGGTIGYDPSLIVQSSARRIMGKPRSFFIEYPRKVVKTFLANKN